MLLDAGEDWQRENAASQSLGNRQVALGVTQIPPSGLHVDWCGIVNACQDATLAQALPHMIAVIDLDYEEMVNRACLRRVLGREVQGKTGEPFPVLLRSPTPMVVLGVEHAELQAQDGGLEVVEALRSAHVVVTIRVSRARSMVSKRAHGCRHGAVIGQDCAGIAYGA